MKTVQNLVYYLKDGQRRKRRWRARITINQKLKNLGYYETEKEAALVYNKAAKEHFGKNARLNKL